MRTAGPKTVIGGDMEYGFAASHSLFQRVGIGEVASDALAGNDGDVLKAACLTHQQAQVGTLLREHASNVASDESCSACNKSLHLSLNAKPGHRPGHALPAGLAGPYFFSRASRLRCRCSFRLPDAFPSTCAPRLRNSCRRLCRVR